MCFQWQRIGSGSVRCSYTSTVVHIKELMETNQKLFTELKNIFSFSRNSILKFWKYKSLAIGFELQMRFLGNHTKCINSLRNRVRKLIFGQNEHSYKAKKVTKAIFDILKIFIMAAIFKWRMAILFFRSVIDFLNSLLLSSFSKHQLI